MSPINTTVSFDMRSPDWATPTAKLYAEALEMAAFADEIAVDRIGLMEHHGSEDGYLPQPFVMAGGVAARTKRCTIGLGAAILPLHDPVKLAEQIAIADKVEDRGTFGFQPLIGGFPPEEGWKSLELLKTAIPKLKALPR